MCHVVVQLYKVVGIVVMCCGVWYSGGCVGVDYNVRYPQQPNLVQAVSFSISRRWLATHSIMCTVCPVCQPCGSPGVFHLDGMSIPCTFRLLYINYDIPHIRLLSYPPDKVVWGRIMDQ